MTEALVDLHMHSTCSDGTWEPAKLFDHIRNNHVEFFCISDHDNMDAYPVPADLRERCIPGLEIDTHYFGNTVHLLGYGIQQGESSLLNRLEEQRRQREMRARAIVEKLNMRGVELTFEEVRRVSGGSKSIGRPHIARALVAKSHCRDIQEAFDIHLAEGEDAYVPLERLATADTINLVRQAGGLAVLAHPKRLKNQTEIQSICNLGIDGIEVMHPSADHDYQTQLFGLADDCGLIATGGTDFHGRSEDKAIGIRFPRARVEELLNKLSIPN